MASDAGVAHITALYNKVLGGRYVPDLSSGPPGAIRQDASITPTTNDNALMRRSVTNKDGIPELKTVIQFEDDKGKNIIEFDGYTFPTDDEKAEDSEAKEAEDDEFAGFPLLLKAVIGTNRSLEWRLEVQAPGLIAIFREVGAKFQELNLHSTPLVIEHPFRCLFFLRDQLESLPREPLDPDTRIGLGQLLSFIKSPMGHQRDIEAYNDQVTSGGKISFFMLWMLFAPFEPVIRCRPNQKIEDSQCFILESFKPFYSNGVPMWELSLLFGTCNSEEYFVRRKTKYIKYFDGFRRIDHHSMRFIPLRILQEGRSHSIRESLVGRGKSYVEVCTKKYSLWHYKGWAYLSGSGKAKEMSTHMDRRITVNERVVIDRSSQDKIGSVSDDRGEYVARRLSKVLPEPPATESSPLDTTEPESSQVQSSPRGGLLGFTPEGWSQVRGDWGSIDPTGYSKPELPPMTDDDYMICRNVTSVYALRQKIWVKMVNFNHLSEIVFNGDPFRSLQFPSHRKQFIHRLVEGFQKGKGGSYDDVIEGKGKGLIFLLYGPPGLGKTLTAESVAEVAKRPLYHISAGELSTDVSSLEDELRTIFRMGARWNAIVLLDEADVLMSKRTSDNLTRNSVVAVFLRMLEYYRGMLFLTTNRRDDFDDAFFNRIHVTIEYSELDATSRTNIWRSHIARATKENRRTDLWTESMYEALGQIKLNGRDIKNYVRTAYAFTRAMDGEDLGLEQVVSVLRNSLSGSGVPGSIVFESAQGVDSVLGKLDELVHRSVKTMENSFGDALGVVDGRT